MFNNRLGKKINRIGKRLGNKINSVGSRLGLKNVFKKNTLKPKDGMTDSEKLSAKIAEDAYEKNRKDFGDFKYDSNLSDGDRAVYHNKITKKTRIGYKGTDNLKDVKTDVFDSKGNILKGTQNKNPQYRRDLDHFGKDIALSGHSLGGSRTYNVSKERNVKGDAFNTGRGFDKSLKINKKKCNTPNPPSWCNKMTSLRISGDPLSLMNKDAYGKHKTFESAGLKSHFMSNFNK